MGNKKSVTVVVEGDTEVTIKPLAARLAVEGAGMTDSETSRKMTGTGTGTNDRSSSIDADADVDIEF